MIVNISSATMKIEISVPAQPGIPWAGRVILERTNDGFVDNRVEWKHGLHHMVDELIASFTAK